jgi:hypothetical protein
MRLPPAKGVARVEVWNADDDVSERDEWEWRYLLFPRFALNVNRTGMRTRLIWPGRYLVRWSRTYKRFVYRRR